MASDLTIRGAIAADALGISAIYNHHVMHTIVTFEEEPVTITELTRRIEEVQAASLPWLVAEEDGRIAGYAYASKWRPRSAYRFSVEATVYIDSESTGRGVGSLLYAELFPMLERRGVHAVMGGISLPNDASVALHEKFGMRKVAHFNEVGFKLGRWIDVGYWERVFGLDPH